MSADRSIDLPGPEQNQAFGWSAAIVRMRGKVTTDDTGSSELMLMAIERSRRFERWVLAAVLLNMALTATGLVVWLRSSLPSMIDLYARVDAINGWQAIAFAIGGAWLAYAAFGYRNMRRAQAWIFKSHASDMRLDRHMSDPL